MAPASMVDNNLSSLDPFSSMSLDPFSTQQQASTSSGGDCNNQYFLSSMATPPQDMSQNNNNMTNSKTAPNMNTGGFSQQQQQQHYQQQQQQPMEITPLTTHQAALASPPISPLAFSPGQTPPGPNQMQGTANQNGMSNTIPSLPTGFGNEQQTVAANVAPVPTLSPSSPTQAATAAANPFDMYAPTQPSAVPNSDQFATGKQQQQQIQQNDDNAFWNDMGFGSNTNTANEQQDTAPALQSNNSYSSAGSDDASSSNMYAQVDNSLDDTPVTLDEHGLPSGGEYYNARVTTAMLGAIFSSGKELRSTLFKSASNSYVEAIGDRPVISFTIDGSAADTAGIQLGHVLLNVNGEPVHHTDDAVKMVGSASRPMLMEFYIPSKNVRCVKTEGQCMVKYDNQSSDAPKSACEWKPKYVVVGDMLGKQHVVYMYRSKVRK